jgi:hypothetical protein
MGGWQSVSDGHVEFDFHGFAHHEAEDLAAHSPGLSDVTEPVTIAPRLRSRAVLTVRSGSQNWPHSLHVVR